MEKIERVVPEPAHFTQKEYEKFKEDYPDVGEILDNSEPHTIEGQEPLLIVKKDGEDVYVYFLLLSKENQNKLGKKALRELYKRLMRDKPRKNQSASVRFTSEEYEEFLGEYGISVKNILKTIHNEDGGKILINLDQLSDEQKENLGKAYHELQKHLRKQNTPWGHILSSIGIIGIIAVIGILWKIGRIEDILGTTPTSTPTPTAIVTPAAAPTTTPRPTYTYTPRPQPTARPTVAATIRPTVPSRPVLTTAPATEVSIEKVALQDERKAFIPAIDGMHVVKPGERATLDVQLNVPAQDTIKFEYSAAFGTIEADSAYIAPVKPGGKDLLTVKVVNKETGKLLAQRVVKIQIMSTQ